MNRLSKEAHALEEINGVRCAVVEKNATPERVEFLKRLLEHNGYTVMVAASPPPKVVSAKPAAPHVEGQEAPPPPPPPPPAPETFTIGVTDELFHAMLLIYERSLKTFEGKIVSIDYWNQQPGKKDSIIGSGISLRILFNRLFMKTNKKAGIVFVFFLLFSSVNLFSQTAPPTPGYSKQKKITAFQQIFDLKKECLLIMLYEQKNKINALKELGRAGDAETVERNQARKNKEIIKAFKDYFTFCPVYFFSNQQMADLGDHGIKNIIFLNDSLNPDSLINPAFNDFFVAHFGAISQDTSSKYPTNNGEPALVVLSDNLVQLKKPFPFYVFISEMDDRIFEVNEAVSKFNNNLHDFYRTAQVKTLKSKYYRYFHE